MRQNQNSRRSRGRTGSNGGNGRSQNGRPIPDNRQPNRKNYSSSNRQYDSQGPDGKNRGTASQLSERYKTLSREALATDRTLAEAFSQFADHYFRLAAEAAEFEGEAERGREAAHSHEAMHAGEVTQGDDTARNGPDHSDRSPGPSMNGNSNGNVAETSDHGSQSPVSNVDGGEEDQASGEGHKEGGREGTRSPWGMSRRRRGQNHRDARQGAMFGDAQVAPPVAAPPAPAAPVSVSENPAPEKAPKVDVEVAAPRRRLTSTTTRKAATVAEASEKSVTVPDVVEAAPAEAKPVARRGRPRKVVVSEEPVS